MNRELLKRVIAECSDEGSSSNITTALYCEIAEYLEMPEPAEPVAWLSDRGTIWHDKQDAVDDSDGFVEPLYTTPPDQSARIAELTQHLKDAHAENAEFCQIIERQTKQLAAMQAKREPLSDDEIDDLLNSDDAESGGSHRFARAIEAAHNIGVNRG